MSTCEEFVESVTESNPPLMGIGKTDVNIVVR
jgi:hypothetical protein